MPSLDLNPEFQKALRLMEETSDSVFITGKAGTGKSTLLRYFLEKTGKEVVVLAPTGVAALNVDGQTIHSFFRFSTHVTPQEVKKKRFSGDQIALFKALKTIVIDEVSMVRADLMDCVSLALQKARGSKLPFGGLQMIFIGDLYQLPPVVASPEERELFRTVYASPYFFDAKVLEDLPNGETSASRHFPLHMVELEKIYRQKDEKFIELLNKIRNNSIQPEDIEILNDRHGKLPVSVSKKGFAITLTTTNAAADMINDERLTHMKAPKKSYHATIAGDFDRSHFPTAEVLHLKVGAQVMMLSNDGAGAWVNGSMGVIVDIEESDSGMDPDALVVRLSDGKKVLVTPHTWEVRQYVYRSGQEHLEQEELGSFRQYPVRLAWAVTIHKSQGKTFDEVVIDIGKGSFAHGQTYVALSRCTSFEGLSLVKPLQKRHVIMDFRVVKFLTGFQYKKSLEKMPLDEKCAILSKAIVSGNRIQMTYLKANDTKSKRSVIPKKIGEMSYGGVSFLGLEAFCLSRQDDRVFRVDRILELEENVY